MSVTSTDNELFAALFGEDEDADAAFKVPRSEAGPRQS